jgi:hypothetical protein
MNALFLFTYQSLARSESLTSMQMLTFVNRTLIAINLIGIIAPAALIALVLLLVREPTSGWTEQEPIHPASPGNADTGPLGIHISGLGSSAHVCVDVVGARVTE